MILPLRLKNSNQVNLKWVWPIHPCVFLMQWVEKLYSSFTRFLAHNISNNINWNELLNVFHRLSSSRWEMVLLRHKSTGASCTSEKCKQLSFISVRIMRWTTHKLLSRLDFFLGNNTTNWACYSWFRLAIESHHSSFPFWFKFEKKRHLFCYWAPHSESISNSCTVE